MRLTALRLLGFKSFPDQTELRFGPGVTAVVGPNGSGKSNIVDATRWVLGEQNSRALRSQRVADLIFGGTAERKPLGMGQVTLVIDNSDGTLPLEYTEINIMRRVHRSGESEFFINGTPCRLRDIQQLLLGTGLGRGGMAVVGQGEIDVILSADSSDRRMLIEETAGTSRYTAQKRLTEQRLARARMDLDRVQDLAAELTDRAAALEEQAKTAQRYRELTKALHAHRAARAARDWLAATARLRESEAELAAARSALQAAERDEAAATAAARQAQAEATVAREGLDEARAMLHETETRSAAVRHRLELVEVQYQSAQQRLATLDAELARCEQEQHAAETQLREADAAVDTAGNAVAALKLQVAEAERQLAEYDAAYDREAARVEAARNELFELRQTIAERRHALDRLQADADRLVQERDRWRRSVGSLEEQLAAADVAYDEARSQCEASASRLQGRKQAAEELALKLQAAREELDARRRAVEAARATLQETQATQRALARLEETYAGYRPAVKAVLGAAAELGGIRGTVAQLLDVPARFDRAVQVALGGATQYIIVADEQAVQRAIDYLRERRAGRATFLALDSVRPRPWPTNERHVLNRAGVLGVAAELVDADEAVRSVVDYLLGRILIVESLPQAQSIARGLHSGLRLVTVAGDLIVPGGPVTGGSAPSAAGDGLLSRRREQKQLASREQRARAEVVRCNDAAAAALERVQALEQTAAASQDDTQADTLALAENRQRVAQAEAERDRLRRAAAEARARLEEAEERLHADGPRAERLRTDIAALEQRAEAMQESIAELVEASRHDEEQRRRLSAQVADAKAQWAAREEALRGVGRERERWRAAAEEAARQLERLTESRAALVEDQARLHTELERLQRQAPAAQSAVSAAMERAEAAAAALTMVGQTVEETAAAAEEAVQRASAARESVWAAEAALARHSAAVDNCRERLVELELPPEEAEHVARRERASVRAIRDMEDELAALGAVNLGAEQELEELRERLGFLEEQQADLMRAVDGLEQAIQRLDKVSREQFADAFDRVASHFSHTFRRLFGGGRAELTLTEDGGVDVAVQMPGKRAQNLLALSGGERALTAIALMFALLRVQPSPFYVLDEVDSALDEANLGRFQSLLREAARDAQFIVVTHRATTMEVADTLYGVTAAAAGVSTVMSLNLQEAIATTA